MERGVIIGNVVAKEEGRWEWMIPEFLTLSLRTAAYFYSPIFNADGERWCLWIYPTGTSRDTRIRITLCRRSSISGKSTSCTVGVKRSDHSEETIGTNSGDIIISSYNFNKTRTELEEGGWLSDGQLTVTCLFGGAKQDFSANRKFTSRETQTDELDVTMGKNERLEDCASTAAKGVERLSENVKGLLTEGDGDYDVRIFVKGREFRAHNCILKTRSPVLGKMVAHDSEDKNPGTIHIEDCDPDCFDELLIFIYHGRAENLTSSKALHLYYAADKYGLPRLKQQCVHFLKASLSATSVCDVVQLAAKHGEKQLLRTAAKYLVKNLKTISSTVEWQNFMAEYPAVANELCIKGLLPKDT